MKQSFLIITFAFIIVTISGCIQTLAVRTVGGILNDGIDAFYEESDLELARGGLEGNLKLLEAMIKADPANEELLLFASQGFSAYALAFAEDDSVERARMLYLRARNYGLRALKERTGLDPLSLQLDALRDGFRTLSADDVPCVFWTGFAWGAYINVNRESPSALGDLSKVDVLMNFVLERDRPFYYGGADIYFGSTKATVPAVLGGKPEEARAHFEHAIELSAGKFLMAKVYFAKIYCAQTLNQELFNKLLDEVESASLDDAPEIRLPNAVAKEKARKLRMMESELF